jgi:hypothetical protein
MDLMSGPITIGRVGITIIGGGTTRNSRIGHFGTAAIGGGKILSA